MPRRPIEPQSPCAARRSRYASACRSDGRSLAAAFGPRSQCRSDRRRALLPDKPIGTDDQHGSGDRRKQSIEPSKKRRSPLENVIRPRSLRLSTMICCRSAALSASSADLKRNGVARRPKTRRISAIISANAIPIRHRVKLDDPFGTYNPAFYQRTGGSVRRIS